MCDACSCSCCSHGSSSGVGKQVQNLRLSSFRAGLLQDRREPVPVDRLLREKSGVLEAERLQHEMTLLTVSGVGDHPFLGKGEEFPVSATAFAAVIMSVRTIPVMSLPGRPDYLRVGTDQTIFAPALQLLSAGGVQYFIIFPLIGKPHNALSFLCIFTIRILFATLSVTYFRPVSQIRFIRGSIFHRHRHFITLPY